ncbi:homeobox protein PKNOX1-like [Agrilus planipennis]|uniref:Homeobox protein PKNOX1-like n=1 Tax=Agrilus planipennis TaxID=224129 RepID=A0A1W4WI05_AGRPL|nr:homeobox protein PKNOX1-like [Agrilus planipennis]XP_018323582.1 homeobox protein PKNOX1-like [Agrilus planipennis]XP_025830967.1 homeobox protein PKNOX1-like [Agrilus planipennis]
MECGVQGGMLSVPPGGDNGPQPTLPSTSLFAPPDTDQAQFEADKRAVYKHPLFPLLALLFERCELATQSADSQSSDAFNLDIQAFVQHQERDRKPFLANEPEIDGLMIKAIQVLRIHLLELEKVQELCKDFCNRYITCLKGKMQSENLLRSDYPQGPTVMNGNLETNNNSMLSHGNSDSGSNSNSPVQYNSVNNSQVVSAPGGTPTPMDRPVEGHNGFGGGLHYSSTPTPPLQQQQQQQHTPSTCSDPLVVHGSTPLSQIGANVCPPPPPSDSSGQVSPAPTTPGGSEECDSDFTSRIGRKPKRGVLPKQATSVMRSWLFQHLVHPYPTEDEKRHIAAQTNLTLLQVNNWFINARRRILQPMLDASAPSDNGNIGTSPVHKKKKVQNNNRRFWPQDFSGMQPQLDSGILSSSDDEGDSYSSDGDEGSLVIDSGTTQNNDVTQNGHRDVDTLTFANSDSERS